MTRRKQARPRHFHEQLDSTFVLENGLSSESQSEEDDVNDLTDAHVCGKCNAELFGLANFLKHKKTCRRKRLVLIVDENGRLPAEDGVDSQNNLVKEHDNNFTDIMDTDDYSQSAMGQTRSSSDTSQVSPPFKLPDSNLVLESIRNTKKAVAQFATNNFPPSDLQALYNTLDSLQQHQLVQLELLQQLQVQLTGSVPSVARPSFGTGQSEAPSSFPIISSLSPIISNITSTPTSAILTPILSRLPLHSTSQASAQTSTICTVASTTSTTVTSSAITSAESSISKSAPTSSKSLGSTPVLPSKSPGALELLAQTAVGALPSPGPVDMAQIMSHNPNFNMFDKRSDDPFLRRRCQYCGKAFGSDSALQIHIRSHTGERPFKCNICGSRFTTKGNLKVHFQRHKAKYPHIPMNPHPVPEYLDHITTSASMLPHMPPVFTGPHMPLPLIGPAGTPLAMPPIMSSASMISGPLPPPSTRDSNQLTFKDNDDSMGGSVSPSEPLSPDAEYGPNDSAADKMDDEAIEMDMDDRKSLSSESVNSLSAPSASAAFPSFSEANIPTEDPLSVNTSGGESPVQEIISPTKFASGDLEEYMEVARTPETSKLQQLVNNIESKSATEANQCIICNRVLSCKSALNMHYRTHTGERPFKCRICSRAFTTKGNLKTHMGVHRIKLPGRVLNNCPICQKQFSNSVVLQQHIRMHSEGHHMLPLPSSDAQQMQLSPGQSLASSGISPREKNDQYSAKCSDGEQQSPNDPPNNTIHNSNIRASPSASASEMTNEDAMSEQDVMLEIAHQRQKSFDILSHSQSMPVLPTHNDASAAELSSHVQMMAKQALHMQMMSDLSFHERLMLEHSFSSKMMASYFDNQRAMNEKPEYSANQHSPRSDSLFQNPGHLQFRADQIDKQLQDNFTGDKFPGYPIKLESGGQEERIANSFQNKFSRDMPRDMSVTDESECSRYDKFGTSTLQYSRHSEVKPKELLDTGYQHSHESQTELNSSVSPTSNKSFEENIAAKEKTEMSVATLRPQSEGSCHSYEEGSLSSEKDQRDKELSLLLATSDSQTLNKDIQSTQHDIKNMMSQPKTNGMGVLDLSTGTNITCKVCFKPLLSPSDVDIHMRLHGIEKSYQCEVCDRSFLSKDNLKQHMLTHKIRDLPPQAFQGEKRHRENQDENSYPVRQHSPHNVQQQQQQHQQRMAQDSRHQCQVCMKHFSSSSAVQIHMRTHTGEKPFKCNVCNKAFTTKGNLKVHMGTHMWNNQSRRGRRMSFPDHPVPNPVDAARIMNSLNRPPGPDSLFFPFPTSFANGLTPKMSEPPLMLTGSTAAVSSSAGPSPPLTGSLTKREKLEASDRSFEESIPRGPGLWMWSTTCKVCNKDCGTPAGLFTHVTTEHSLDTAVTATSV